MEPAGGCVWVCGGGGRGVATPVRLAQAPPLPRVSDWSALRLGAGGRKILPQLPWKREEKKKILALFPGPFGSHFQSLSSLHLPLLFFILEKLGHSVAEVGWIPAFSGRKDPSPLSVAPT